MDTSTKTYVMPAYGDYLPYVLGSEDRPITDETIADGEIAWELWIAKKTGAPNTTVAKNWHPLPSLAWAAARG
ncbi:MAG: hypothetical protein LBD43_03095 [Holosporales bacterium]|nr:hypothetical protein [Holosporales bacterium]